MFGFGGKNKKDATPLKAEKKDVKHADASKKTSTTAAGGRAPTGAQNKAQPMRQVRMPNGKAPAQHKPPVSAGDRRVTAQNTRPQVQSRPSNTSRAPVHNPEDTKDIKQRAGSQTPPAKTEGAKPKDKKPKLPRGPLITAEGVKHGAFVLVASILLATLLLCLMNFTLYALNHFDFEFGYDVTVKLEDGADKTVKFVYDKESVFRMKGKEAYISLSKLADSLSLSTVGNGEKVKFYKTNDLNNYVSLEDDSRHVIINGESICLSSPVHISGSQVFVPISFFERYTSSIIVKYDDGSHTMTVEYAINEELSTPKRKVLEEFRFVVTSPVGLEEMTEEERNEYAGLSKG